MPPGPPSGGGLISPTLRPGGGFLCVGWVGDAYDNAMCESFFATLECELLDRSHFRSPEEAERAVFEFIEGWYNTRRRHSALNYNSPIQYELRYWGVDRERGQESARQRRQH